ncbi:DUF930 domain-containing protein [Rhizobium phaseoli]|uniref:DUF930 domain-containing protein n=1 Tax=Rhizobium phaseoli TaxID=396 RepID=UPI0014383B50|nr:DUF930 domain-containing protein [Rhizobium phaseoli]MDK4725429.1 DUF930 domain-containing protein [Rhizobium phaseoli]NKE87232.1 DUF930 domain-containing protein [Rhizobium phaseoli]
MWLDAAGFKGHIAAVTEEDVEPAEAHEAPEQRPEIRWGVGASVLLHVPLIALLIFGLPKIEPKPPEDESVKVELVPPPEEKKPEEKKPEKPPEPKPPEQAKKQPPPPPPPPPPAENKPAAEAKPAAPMPTFNPVFEFGDTDSGPQKSATGNSSEGEKKPATTAPQHGAKPEQARAEASVQKPQTETPPARPIPDDLQLPEVAATVVSPERNAPLAEVTGEASTDIEALKPPEQKSPEPPITDAANDNLVKAKTLFSQAADDDPMARIAMNGVPRSKRVAQLCRSELQQQLIHGSPSFQPIIVPSQGLSRGTVLDLRAAFRTAEGWYDVHFRCEVDQDAMKVVSFAFDVSGAIPRSQWKSRNLPGD